MKLSIYQQYNKTSSIINFIIKALFFCKHSCQIDFENLDGARRPHITVPSITNELTFVAGETMKVTGNCAS